MAHVSLVPPEGAGPSIISVDGELDFATVPALFQRLDSVSGDVELDCSRLTFLDCNGLDALIGAHRALEARGDRLTVRGLSGVCLRVVRMARADSLLRLVWPEPSDPPGGGARLAVVREPSDPMEVLLERARALGGNESGLSVLVTARDDGSAPATVVNAGVLDHPLTGAPVVGIVVRGHARKLVHLRARPRATVVFRSGWDWVTVEGTVELSGPDDEHPEIGPDGARRLIRQIYAAAVGGSEDDWSALDDEFESERHTAVLVLPDRVYSNRDR